MESLRLIGYVRVSTEEQASEGESLAAQKENLHQYCKVFGHELLSIIEDAGVSAKSLKREGLQQCFAMLRSGFAEGLIVTRLDRLSRRVFDLSGLVETVFKRSAFLSVKEQIDTSTASGMLHFNILASMAQWEREVLSERTSDTMQSMIARGVQVGRAPYGLRYSENTDEQGRKYLEVEPSEMKIAKLVLFWRQLEPPMSYSRIAKMLNQQGVSTRRGAKWHAQTISNIAKRGQSVLEKAKGKEKKEKEGQEVAAQNGRSNACQV